MKDKFSKGTSLNEQLSNNLKASISLKCEFNKTKKENEKLSKKVLELKNSNYEFHKEKETLNTLLAS